MARLYLNSEEVTVPPPVFLSLDHVMKHVEANLLPPDEVIRQICLDGAPVNAESLQQNPSMLLSDLTGRERVEITTCTVKEVALDSVREAGMYLDRVEAITPSLAATFRDFPGPEAFENLRQLYDGFYWLSLLMAKLEPLLGIDMEATLVGKITLHDHHERFLGILKQLIAAQEQSDYLLIADLLEYEVLPIIPAWKTLFNTTADSTLEKD